MRICEKIVLFLNIGKDKLVKKKKKFAQKAILSHLLLLNLRVILLLCYIGGMKFCEDIEKVGEQFSLYR